MEQLLVKMKIGCHVVVAAALAWGKPVVAAGLAESAAEWQVSAGLGVITTPWSLGAMRQRYLVLPTVDLRYADWFFANAIDGIGVRTASGGLTASVAIAPDLAGREPEAGGRFARLSRKSPSAAIRLRLDWEFEEFTTSAQLSSRFGDRARAGNTLALEGGYNCLTRSRLLFNVGALGRWVDDRLAQNLVSVSPSDALASGLPAYRASSGVLERGLYGQAVIRISDDWTGFSRLELTRLGSAIDAAPYVERRSGATFLMFASRAF